MHSTGTPGEDTATLSPIHTPNYWGPSEVDLKELLLLLLFQTGYTLLLIDLLLTYQPI